MAEDDAEARAQELEQRLQILEDFANSLYSDMQDLVDSVNKERELYQRRLQDLDEDDE